MDDLIRDFYSVFDNRDGRKPTVDDVTRFFLDGAVIAKKTSSGLEISNAVQFAVPRIALLGGAELKDFHEWEAASETKTAGDLATRVSRYAKSGTYNGAPWNGAGTKIFQLVRVDARWKILSLAWADDE
ncbi:MAG TPA: hypothetical protein VMZ74_05590 [Ramlibacter sp.]|nr:hypothetical protein [Ramlibacter sp.]